MIRRYDAMPRRRLRRGRYTHNGLIVGLLFTIAFVAFLFAFIAVMARA